MKKPIAGGAGSAAPVEVALAHSRASRRRSRAGLLENERFLALVLLTPTVLLLGLFIAYPFVMGVWFSLSNISVGNPGHFVGLHNFLKAWNDSIFRIAFWNTSFYTFWATIFKLVLGMWLALLLNRHFRGKRIVRASMLLPFIVPTVLSTFAWRWMFDPTFSVLNWTLYKTGFRSGHVTCQNRFQPFAPSSEAASCKSVLIVCRPASRVIAKNGMPRQVLTAIAHQSAQSPLDKNGSLVTMKPVL